MEPSLTTVRIPAKTIGEKAGGLIVRLIAGEETALIREEFPTEMMVRGSTLAR